MVEATEFCEEVECVYCGHIHTDSWCFFDDEHQNEIEAECSKCGRVFVLERDFEVTYQTRTKAVAG